MHFAKEKLEGDVTAPMLCYEPKLDLTTTLCSCIKKFKAIFKKQHIIKVTSPCGPVAQHGWSVRLIIERSPVQIRLGPPISLKVFSSPFIMEHNFFFDGGSLLFFFFALLFLRLSYLDIYFKTAFLRFLGLRLPSPPF